MAEGSSSRDDPGYHSLLDQRGRFRADYNQSGPWPNRFWWWEIKDADDHTIASTTEQVIADFIVDQLNGGR